MAFYENVELQVTCSALGYYDNGKYYKEPDCLESIKDLIRFIKRDSEACLVRRGVGSSAIVQNDLIPLIKEYSDDRILLETVVRLLVNLTQPARLCFMGIIPDDKERRLCYLEIESQLQVYKQAFADEELFAVLTNTLGDLLKLDWEHRHEEDKLLIERILILIRNILHIPKNALKEQRADGDISIHDQIIWALHASGMEDLIIYIASSDSDKQFVMHILEIITLMLREQSPELLANVGQNRSISEKEEDTRELEHALEKEIIQKKMNAMKCSTRHSTFGGTFVVRNMKSISENNIITHQPLTAIQKSINFDKDKNPRKKAKNRISMVAVDPVRRSALSIRTLLRSFCQRLVEMAYNPLMKTIKDMLVRARTQENDETYFIFLMKFMMEFVRRDHFKPELICETLSSANFHYISNQLEVYCEHMSNDKKELLIWSKRMHLALKAYHELLNNLVAMDMSKDINIKESSRVIKSNIFYTMEYREILLSLFKKFEMSRQSKMFLTDLINANHQFLRLLEKFCKSNSHIVIEKKKQIKIKKSKSKKKKENIDDLWSCVSGRISAAIQSLDETTIQEVPFDAASNLDNQQQKIDAMKRIQRYLKSNLADQAVSLFRAARDVWPEGEFGDLDITPEDEFMALREICYSNLGNQDNEDVKKEDDEFEELENHYETVEQNFSFNDYILRFANPQVIRALILLLEDYTKNSAATNHAIIRMFHRISIDCKLPAILFQMKLFQVFHQMQQDPAYCRAKQYDEIRLFGKHLLRKFFDLAKINNKLFMELFFWKSSRDAIEIMDGYGTYNTSKVKKLWSDEDNEELKILYDECKESDEMDVVDGILSRMSDRSKSRRQVIRQLVMLDIITGAKEIKKKKENKIEKRWTDTEIERLTKSYPESELEPDRIAYLIEHLSLKKSRVSIIHKILELGLASDKKEFYRKRTRKLKRGEGNIENDVSERETYFVDYHKQSGDEQSDDDIDDEENDPDSDTDANYNNNNDDDDLINDYDDYLKSKLSNKSNDATASCTLMQIKNFCTIYLQNNGSKEMLNWIARCFERTAEDKDDDDEMYAIPIVPLTEEQDDALSNKHYIKLLSTCGLKMPANEQEKFWRIPVNLNSTFLRSAADLIKNSVETFSNLNAFNEVNIECEVSNPNSKTLNQDPGSTGNNLAKDSLRSTSFVAGSFKGSKRKRLEELIKSKRTRLNKSKDEATSNNTDDLINKNEESSSKIAKASKTFKKNNVSQGYDGSDDDFSTLRGDEHIQNIRSKRNLSNDVDLDDNADEKIANKHEKRNYITSKVNVEDDDKSSSSSQSNFLSKRKSVVNKNKRLIIDDDSDGSHLSETNESIKKDLFDYVVDDDDFPCPIKQKSIMKSINDKDNDDLPISSKPTMKTIIRESNNDDLHNSFNSKSSKKIIFNDDSDDEDGLLLPKQKSKKKKVPTATLR